MELVASAWRVESLRRILADRLQEAVPSRAVPCHRHDEGRLDESADELFGARKVAVRADRGDRVETERPGEDGESCQQLTLVRLEQVVAPVNRRSERLVPWRGQP